MDFVDFADFGGFWRILATVTVGVFWQILVDLSHTRKSVFEEEPAVKVGELTRRVVSSVSQQRENS